MALEARLDVIGGGCFEAADVTREGEGRLRAATTIYHANLHPSLVEYLKSYARPLHDLAPQLAVFEEAAQALTQAARRHPPVAYVVAGDPVFYNAFLPHLSRVASAQQVKLAVTPGVSSLTRVCAAIGLDPARSGAQLMEARLFLHRASAPSTQIPLLLFGVSYIEGTAPLLRALLQYYPPAWPLTHVRLAMGLGEPTRVETVPVTELETLALDYGSTLVLAGAP